MNRLKGCLARLNAMEAALAPLPTDEAIAEALRKAPPTPAIVACWKIAAVFCRASARLQDEGRAADALKLQHWAGEVLDKTTNEQTALAALAHFRALADQYRSDAKVPI
jgi:hypothetical protein